jgi:hypothetical protein
MKISSIRTVFAVARGDRQDCSPAPVSSPPSLPPSPSVLSLSCSVSYNVQYSLPDSPQLPPSVESSTTHFFFFQADWRVPLASGVFTNLELFLGAVLRSSSDTSLEFSNISVRRAVVLLRTAAEIGGSIAM